jgi:hypothetical protein
MTTFLLLSDGCGFVDVGRSLWREDGSVVYNCSWPPPAQSFSGPSPVRLVTIFYCLRFETSLLAASYDSQGYGGGIRPRLHRGTPQASQSQSQSYVTRVAARVFSEPLPSNALSKSITVFTAHIFWVISGTVKERKNKCLSSKNLKGWTLEESSTTIHRNLVYTECTLGNGECPT